MATRHAAQRDPTYPGDSSPFCLVGVVQETMIAKHLRHREVGGQLVDGHAMLVVASKDLGGLVHERRRGHGHLKGRVDVVHDDRGGREVALSRTLADTWLGWSKTGGSVGYRSGLGGGEGGTWPGAWVARLAGQGREGGLGPS